MPNFTNSYSSNYYDPNTGSNTVTNPNSANNVVTRRLFFRDRVAFAQSTRFGGQWMEPKGDLLPYGSTIMDAVASTQQLLQQLNLGSTLLPDLGGIPVILSAVGVATNTLGAGVSYINGITLGTTATVIDGVGLSTGLRVLFYGLTTSASNGVYSVTTGLGFTRATDMQYWWQFVKPRTFIAQQGTNNKGNVYGISTDAFELGEGFVVGLGLTFATVGSVPAVSPGTPISFQLNTYSPGIGTTTTSLIYPPYSVGAYGVGGTGEYDFLGQNSLAEFAYIAKRTRRLAFRFFTMFAQYQPQYSSYWNNVILPIGLANTLNNIGYNTSNNLPSGSRYPSSMNRGW